MLQLLTLLFRFIGFSKCTQQSKILGYSSFNVSLQSLIQDIIGKQIRTGLVFFGTPHDGGDKSLVALGSAAARVATKLHVQPSSDIVEALKSGSLFSDILQEHWRQQLLSYQIISFWEGIGDVS